MIEAQILENHKIMISKNAVSDSVKYETIRFRFPKSWDTYVKTATFKTEDATVSVILQEGNPLCVSENECYIPHEALSFPGFSVSVFGNESDTLATTANGFVTVIKSGYEEGVSPKEPTPDEYSQIIALMTETKDIAQSVRDDADNGLFKGEKGDKGDKGDSGTGNVLADQKYNPKSENAQSGKAVAEALKSSVGTTTEQGGEIFNDYEYNAATGSKSHAEGRRTQAKNDYAHSEGNETFAAGNSSHAEGTGTRAEGRGAHSEGDTTKALGEASHAEGAATEATGSMSHAEGVKTTASGNYSHSEGDTAIASGEASHAEGGSTKAEGTYSHAEGANSKSSGEAAHAEGYATEASGQFSHAEGYNTKATGAYSHAAGQGTIADSAAQTVVGKFNKSNGRAVFIVGNGTANDKRNNVFVVYGDGSGAVVTEQGQSDSSVVRMDTMKNAIAASVKTIPSAVETALTEAKESGEFKGDKGDTGPQGPQGEKGADGYTPVKGTDYWTSADKAESLAVRNSKSFFICLSPMM